MIIIIQIILDVFTSIGAYIILHDSPHKDWHNYTYFFLALAAIAHTATAQDVIGMATWYLHFMGWALVLSKSIQILWRENGKQQSNKHAQ